MANENLRAALTRSGLTIEEFADVVAVDPKTVQRWLAGRVPHPKSRTRVAGALDTPEQQIWPELGSANDAEGAGGRSVITVPATDVLGGYAHADDPGAPHSRTLIERAGERIEIIARTLDALAGETEQLLARAAAGCEIRVILIEADHRIEQLLAKDRIDVRATLAGEDHGLIRADDQMLLELWKIGYLSEPAPLIHLRRVSPGGLFDRLASHFEVGWREATPISTREDLDSYLDDIEDDEIDEQGARDADRAPEHHEYPSVEPASPASSGGILEPGVPRRWPRRPR